MVSNIQPDWGIILASFMANDRHSLFSGRCMNSVFACVTPRVHVAPWFMLHLEVMSCYWCGRCVYCAICSLRLYTVINVHRVHSVLLLMWLIYIKSFPISQSPTVPSYREAARGVLLLFIVPPLPHTSSSLSHAWTLKWNHTHKYTNTITAGLS